MEAADFAHPARFWPLAWTTAWLAGLALWAVGRSRLGAILRAVRENEERMRFSGFDTYLPRLIAYVLVNVVAAVAGLLHVLNAGFVSPESLGLSISTNALVAALIGGIAGPVPPIMGGLIFAFAQDEFGARGLTQLLTGVAIVLFIVVFPRGVVGGLASAARRLARAIGGWRERS
jgi:branched-chain amino acid transport system permease protein